MADDRSGRDQLIGDREIEVAARWLADRVVDLERSLGREPMLPEYLAEMYGRRLQDFRSQNRPGARIGLAAAGGYLGMIGVHVWPGNVRGFFGTSGHPVFEWSAPCSASQEWRPSDPILDSLLTALASDLADPAQRAVVSDALEERGRMAEAGLLRSETEIAVLEGRVYDAADVFRATQEMQRRAIGAIELMHARLSVANDEIERSNRRADQRDFGLSIQCPPASTYIQDL